MKELENLFLETSMKKRDDIRIAVANALRNDIDPQEIARYALWTIKLFTAKEIPQLDPNESLALLALPESNQESKNNTTMKKQSTDDLKDDVWEKTSNQMKPLVIEDEPTESDEKWLAGYQELYTKLEKKFGEEKGEEN